MKKKGLAVFMAMVLSGISLCGCGGDGGNAASNINVGGGATTAWPAGRWKG